MKKTECVFIAKLLAVIYSRAVNEHGRVEPSSLSKSKKPVLISLIINIVLIIVIDNNHHYQIISLFEEE